MGRKAAIILIVWFVVVVALTTVVFIPLSQWKKHIQSQLPSDVFIQDIQGHWWAGQVNVQLHNLKGGARLDWKVDSLFEPVEWRVSHEKFRGFGQAQVSLSNVELWIDGFSVEADTFNGLMRRERIEVTGAPIIVSRWYANWNFEQKLFTTFRGNAEWLNGVVQYPMGKDMRTSAFSGWALSGRLNAGLPDLMLQSNEGEYLAGAKLLESNELEVTVMPAMIEVLGQRWNGSREYPAFVMVQPMF